jgi:hypothetical protein
MHCLELFLRACHMIYVLRLAHSTAVNPIMLCTREFFTDLLCLTILLEIMLCSNIEILPLLDLLIDFILCVVCRNALQNLLHFVFPHFIIVVTLSLGSGWTADLAMPIHKFVT